MINPKVSVIIPVYGAEAFLPDCIASLRAQTLRDIELIFICDGSPDHSLAILRKETAVIPAVAHQNRGELPQLPPNAIIESNLHLADGLVQPQGIRVPAPLAEIMMDIDETNRLAALAATGDWSALREAVEVDPALEGLDRLYVQEVVRRLVQLNGDVLSRLVDDEEF